MLFHEPDITSERMISTLRRAKSMAAKGPIPTDHPLSAAFYNMLLMLDSSDSSVEDLTYDLVILDWFAHQVDIYSKDNMLTTDPVVCAMLWEWRSRMLFGIS